MAGPKKSEKDLQPREEEGLRPLASRGKGHWAGQMNQRAKKDYIVSWKPQTKSKLHNFESAGPTGVAGAPGESEVKEAGLAAPQSRASSGSQRGSFLVERAGRNK